MNERQRREISTSAMEKIVTDCALFECEKTIKALQDELARLRIPDGWKLVPIEPTKEMCKAIGCSFDGNMESGGESFRVRYARMLDATPTDKQGE